MSSTHRILTALLALSVSMTTSRCEDPEFEMLKQENIKFLQAEKERKIEEEKKREIEEQELAKKEWLDIEKAKQKQKEQEKKLKLEQESSSPESIALEQAKTTLNLAHKEIENFQKTCKTNAGLKNIDLKKNDFKKIIDCLQPEKLTFKSNDNFESIFTVNNDKKQTLKIKKTHQDKDPQQVIPDEAVPKISYIQISYTGKNENVFVKLEKLTNMYIKVKVIGIQDKTGKAKIISFHKNIIKSEMREKKGGAVKTKLFEKKNREWTDITSPSFWRLLF